MHHLTQVAIFLIAALIAVPLFRRLGFGAVLGYLAAGMLMGPSGLGLFADVHQIMQVAEIGVVFLLFVIGLELKPSRLWVMRHAIFVNGSLQMALTAAALALALVLILRLPALEAGLIGFALALSSTAFVLQTLAEKEQLGTVHGRAGFGILLFQDLAVIPALAILPLLTTRDTALDGPSLALSIAQAIGVIAALVIGGRSLLRPLFKAVARWGNDESFTVMALIVVIGAALLMDWAGLSMGLGAFLAGVLLADSEYRHELEGNINPFKGLLLGLFFMSVGMAADLDVLAADPTLILLGALILILIKAAGAWLSSRMAGVDAVNSAQLALILAQGGEFAFVLFYAAHGEGLLPDSMNQQLILIVVVSMMLTPALFFISDRIGKVARIKRPKETYDTIESAEPEIIIAGFGRMGQVVARVLQMRGLAFTALEKDAAHVAMVRRWGNKIYYGQSNNLETLRAAGAERAKLLIVTMDDIEKGIRTIGLAKRNFPKLKIFARARDRHHALHLMELGVDFVMRETWLSSLEMATEVLKTFGDSEATAKTTTAVFREADENLLARQMNHRHDLDHMIKSTDELRRELHELFENDPRMSSIDRRKPAD